MKIIHKREINPQYSFKEWDKELKRGYIYQDLNKDPFGWHFNEILFRFRDWFLVLER